MRELVTHILQEGIPGRANNMCKNPQEGAPLACWRADGGRKSERWGDQAIGSLAGHNKGLSDSRRF